MDDWNAMSWVVVEADTILAFKGLLDRHMYIQGIDRYGLHASRRDLFILALCLAWTLWDKGTNSCAALFFVLRTIILKTLVQLC